MAKKKKSSFKGKVGRNVDKQESAASSYGYLNLPQGVSMFKEEGDTRSNLDILPYIVSDERHMDRDEELDIAVPGGLWYKKPYKVHRNIGPGNDSVVCPTTWGKKCPICEYRQKLFKEGAEQDVTKALKASLRNLYVVIPIGHKKLEEKPHIWDISQYLFQNLLNKELNEDEEYETFPDLEEGWTLKVRFDSVSLGSNKFAETSRIDFKERDEAYEEDILEDIPDLDKVLQVHSYAELEKMLFQYEDPDEDDGEEKETRKYKDADDEDEKPRRSSRKKKDADPEDEEDEKPTRRSTRKKKDEEEEPEEDEKPRRSSRKKKEEDTGHSHDDDADPDEDEDEDEKPTRSTRSSRGSSKNKCPEGYKFGVDTEDYDECDECELWEACIKAKEKNEKDD